ncbi:MAG: nucleotidyl transferase [Desulfurococcales archaeon ex4484_58]|nr:MAG: nucleotidyl transferase [Desulfurococcales archaeon ex4484_58]
MKALILAAGKGLRLRPITETRPKPLIPILCKPLIRWQLEILNTIDEIDEITIVVSYMKESIRNYVESLSLRKKITFIDQGEEMGTGDAVLKGISNYDPDDDVLIVYGDIFLRDWTFLKELVNRSENILVVARVDNPREYGVVIVENDLFKDVIEKPDKPPTNMVNAGIYKFRVKDILENKDIKLSPRGELEFTDIVRRIGDKTDVKILDLGKDSWVDIGMPWNLLEANKLALKNIQHEIKGIVEDHVSINGRVYVGEDARVRSGTYIEGPVYIDREADIGPNARIRPYTVICKGSRVGFSVEVKESLIMEHVHVSHLSYVGDSILCEHVNFGAGTITANLRFDDKPVKMMVKGKIISSGRRKLGAVVGAYVKTGINVSLMPGVKIGSYSWIAPGAVVYKDVPSKKFYRWEGRYYIEDLHI